MTDILMTTAPSIEPRQVQNHHGVVAADAIVGMNIPELIQEIEGGIRAEFAHRGLARSPGHEKAKERVKEMLNTDICEAISGSPDSWKNDIATARNAALQQIIENAQRLGANGIIDIKFNYESIVTDNNSLPIVSVCRVLMVSVTGTAVQI